MADPNKCYFLKKDPNGNPIDNAWYQLSSNWREGRGVSMASSAIATIHQLEDLVQSELMASRRNAQLFCWLTQGANKDEQPPSAFETDTDFANMTDEEVEQAVKDEVGEDDEQVQTVSFNKARENSVVYELLPEGITPNQLQTNHPNTNVEVIVDFLANRCAASMGLSKVFATGNPDDASWKSNQLFSFPAIMEFQKTLEQALDWLFNNWTAWAIKQGQVKSYVASDFMEYVDWSWRKIEDLDAVAHENAIRLALENHTTTYKQILGNSWKEQLQQTAYENKWLLEHGITPPSELMISGGQTEASKKVADVDNNDNKVEGLQ